MNKTRIIRKLFLPRQHQLDRYATEGEQLQRKVLDHLLAKGRKTLWGWEHGFDEVDSYEKFRQS